MAHERHAIVVGTGAGGLAAAAYLAREGFHVIALDQADRVGGFLAPFSRDGYEFDPGVHYVGQARPGQMLHDVLAGLDLDAGELMTELDPDGFDVYRFPDLEARMCRGLDAYRDRLAHMFPEERDGLTHVFDLCRALEEIERLSMSLPQGRLSLSDLGVLKHLPAAISWGRSSFAELLERYIDDARLRAVLAAPSGDIGLPPSRAAAFAALGIIAHYGDGAFFPRGGSGTLRDALVRDAETHGATFRTAARVEEILVDRGTAIGVQIEGGEPIFADIVVSDADPRITYGRLIPHAKLPSRLAKKVSKVVPSLGTFTLYLGMRRDLREHGLGRFNVWHYPSYDIDALYAPLFADNLPAELPFFLSPNSLKDDTGTMAPPGASTLEVTTFVPWRPFARFARQPPHERGDEYRELRRQYADRLLDQIERAYPGLVGDVAVELIATPVSNVDYVGAFEGNAYGPALTPDQWGPFRFSTRSAVRHLYLAGAGVLGDGVAPCLISGRLAARLAAHDMAKKHHRVGERRAA